jgi:hypothetical protein
MTPDASGRLASMMGAMERGQGGATLMSEENARGEDGTSPPRYTRRLSDKILIAFHHACDINDLDVAEQLIRVLEGMLGRRHMPPEANRRKNMESLVAAHERLWHLRNPERE